MKRTRIKAKRDVPRRRNAPRFDVEQWDDANIALAARSRMLCEIGGEPLVGSWWGVDRHHRQRRAVGGDRLANLLITCGTHHHYAHEHPQWARLRGYIVSSSGLARPELVPVLMWGTTWMQLDDNGSSRRADLDCVPDLSDSA
jgi:hypothetical protein